MRERYLQCAVQCVNHKFKDSQKGSLSLLCALWATMVWKVNASVSRASESKRH